MGSIRRHTDGMGDLMAYQLMAGAFVSLLNFAIHVLMAALVVVMARHVAGKTDDLHVFMRLAAVQLVTVVILAIAHVIEISVWAGFYRWAGFDIKGASEFEFAFENYTALGYGDAVAVDGWRLIGPITALNGLLMIGVSVAVIFEIMKLVDIHIGKRRKPGH
jgi:hypothetical protein